MSVKQLPQEIIDIIITCLIPTASIPPLAFNPSDTVTRTLLSLTQTSKAAYKTANHLLYAHCLYIDSCHRLDCLLRTLATPCDASKTLPDVPRLQAITSLFLAPFPDNTINNLLIAGSIHKFFTLVAPNLRHLVVDIPLRSLYPANDILNIRPKLREAFTQLTALETFCSVRDELYLDCYEQSRMNEKEIPVWSLWPELRILAFYNVDVDWDDIWNNLADLTHLHTLVLTRADGLDHVDLVREWGKRCPGRKLDILVVNIEADHFRHGLSRTGPRRQEDKAKVLVCNVPTSYYGDEDEIDLCQEWVKRAMLKRVLPDGDDLDDVFANFL